MNKGFFKLMEYEFKLFLREPIARSEERRVGEEFRYGWSAL